MRHRNSMGSLPLPALLSQVLVAFTIEFDNEFERRTPHRTTRHSAAEGSAHGPWLTSMVMWSNCMQFVTEAGVRVGELEQLARTKTNLNGMERWGYVVVAPDPDDSRPNPPRRDWVIRATAKGRGAQSVWRPLFGEIESRWRHRFGGDAIDHLRESLWDLIRRMDIELPGCLPILGYGLYSRVLPSSPPGAARDPEIAATVSLPALLSKALLAFAVEFERESDVSLAISANVLRLLDAEGVRVRDLPDLSGVSKEAIAVALGFLEKQGYISLSVDPAAGRTRLARLSPKGQQALDAYLRLVVSIEDRWRTHYGKEVADNLRTALERLVDQPSPSSLLFRGLEPHPGGWRASMRPRTTLPHFPMVLHRGGYPDGS